MVSKPTSKGAISADLTIFLMVACELPGLLLAFCLVDVPFIGRLNLMRSLFLLAAMSSLATAFIHQQLLIGRTLFQIHLKDYCSIPSARKLCFFSKS